MGTKTLGQGSNTLGTGHGSNTLGAGQGSNSLGLGSNTHGHVTVEDYVNSSFLLLIRVNHTFRHTYKFLLCLNFFFVRFVKILFAVFIFPSIYFSPL